MDNSKERNMIGQFQIFIQPYIQQQLILYQINNGTSSYYRSQQKVHSYTHLHVDRPNIALHSEIYISLRHQELRKCKNIGYKIYCEEHFIVKHKSKYSCESAMYFNLGSKIIKENCNFAYYFSKTNIKPTVLEGGTKNILAN